ncbi:MAG: hypothetical protein R2779_01360 [Crocinitomicaceae bacterium]
MEALDRNVKKPNENPSIGICSAKQRQRGCWYHRNTDRLVSEYKTH